MLIGTFAIYAWSPRLYTASATVWLNRHVTAASRGRSTVTQRDEEVRVLVSPAAATIEDVLDHASTDDPRPADAAREQARRDMVRSLVDTMKVDAPDASRAVTVSFAAHDAAMAAAVTNRLVDRYVALSRDDTAWTAALDRSRGEAEAARDQMVRAQSAANVYRSDSGTAAARAAAEEVRPVVEIPDARGSDEANGRTVAVLGEQRAQLGADLAKLQERYGPRHPDIIALDARIAEVEEEIASETRRVGALAARDRRAQIRAATLVAGRELAEAQQMRLDAVASSAGERYQSLLEDVRRTEATRAPGGEAHVIARATIPTTPDFPRPWPFVGAGVVAALAFGGAVAFLREARVPGFRDRAMAERRLGLPVIGMVPDIAEVNGAKESGIAVGDLILSNDYPSFGAAFRDIRLGVGVDGVSNRAKSVAIVSAVAEEGKTTVSIGLARSAALAGLRVLLIDCDVRLPAASRALAPQSQNSLADVVGGRVEFERALTRDTPSGAWVLATRRDEAAVAAGVVGSAAMGRLFTRIAGDYDLIVIDAAPALALAETAALASLANSVLLVARWRTTPVGATQLALEKLRDAGARVSALVLTRVSA